MAWFCWLLFAVYTLGVVNNIAKAGGWQPKPLGTGWYAFAAVIDALIAIGIWVWIIQS